MYIRYVPNRALKAFATKNLSETLCNMDAVEHEATAPERRTIGTPLRHAVIRHRLPTDSIFRTSLLRPRIVGYHDRPGTNGMDSRPEHGIATLDGPWQAAGAQPIK
ncbi:MAG: hypothetical protein Fues2KO_26450 [Fuerstiella sp.]